MSVQNAITNGKNHFWKKFIAVQNADQIILSGLVMVLVVHAKERLPLRIARGRNKKTGGIMYKMIQVVGTSPKSFSAAAESAIKGLHDQGEKIYWFEVIEQRGAVRDGKISEFQVKVNAGTKVEK
jgi:dodecin